MRALAGPARVGVPRERTTLIGRTLGHYRIVDRLGSGGMGVVWLAEDLRLRRRVALKMLREDLASSADKATRFEREAKAIAALSHPNIVTIHAIEELDGVRFLAMEYLEGQTLADLIPADGFPLPELLRLAVPVAEALAAAHARGITHRDLKPSNIFVTTEGRVKVLDFGLAKLQGGDVTQIYGRELETTLTQEGTVVGTLHYMSPEQLQLKHVDHRSDLYSLGVVLYEMATGDLPFRGESAAQVISSVLRDRPRRLDDVDSRMPPEIADLVASCLEKDLSKRLASAAEARDRLSAVARALETGALSLASSRLRRLVGGPNRGRVRALAAGIAALAVAVVAIPWALRELRNPKTGADTEPAEVAEAGIPSIAVLPFANYSGDPDYFVDGMTDGVIGALGRLGGVRVISRQSAMHYKNSTKKLPEIATELGVDFLVEGSVARDGNTVHLQARLVRPDPEQQVWAEAYDRSLASAIAMHDAMAVSIARAAGGAIETTYGAEPATQTAVEPAVYELYLQGQYWAAKLGREELSSARVYFDRAIALNPRFAPAWAGLADTLAMTGLFYADTDRYLAEAEAAAQQALSLAPDSAQALGTLSDIAGARWEWQLAEEYVRRAIAIDPSSAQAYRRYWLLLAPQRRFAEARAAIEQARKLDPLSAQTAANLGLQELFEDRLDEAERMLLSALSLDSDYRLVHAYLWVLYSTLERDPDRGLELIKYLSAVGYSDDVVGLEERIASEGYAKALRELALRLDTKYSDEPDRLGVIAGLLAESGETDRALAWLRAGVSRRAWSLGWLPVAPDLRRLRDRPEFYELIRELGLEPESK